VGERVGYLKIDSLKESFGGIGREVRSMRVTVEPGKYLKLKMRTQGGKKGMRERI